MMRRLIDELFLQEFSDEAALPGDDAAVMALDMGPGDRLAMSTDSFVVTPHFFPGGNIGHLAVCGTVNDVATAGARVKYLSCGFVLEEGYPIESLRDIVKTMAATAAEAGVAIVTGDTKVVERGHADGVFINTAGVGVVPAGRALSGANCRPGDKILLSGTLGDHGIAIISQREGLAFSTTIESDAAPLNGLIEEVLAAAPNTRAFRDPTRGGLASTLNEFAESSGVGILVDEAPLNGLIEEVLAAAPNTRAFRDPTRGGLASTLNEFAESSGVGILVDEALVPVRDEVRGACEMLGYDVFQVANEGKMVAVVPDDEADAALAAMQANKYGANAAIIGEVCEPDIHGGRTVRLRTPFGATRVLDMLVGEQLPRIC